MTIEARDSATAPSANETGGSTNCQRILTGRSLAQRLVPRSDIARDLSVSTAMHTVGTGLVVTLTAVYFTRVVKLPAAEVGLGLTIGGAISLFVGIPLGRVADRINPKRLLALMLACQGSTILLYTFARSFPVFLLVVSLLAIANQGASAVRATLIARVIPPDQRLSVRAYLRAVTNLGFAVGTLLAGVALASSSRHTYQVMFVISTACFLVAAGAMLRVRSSRPGVSASIGNRWFALSDKRYVAVVAANALLQLHYAVLEVGIPIWVSAHTDAPRSMVSILFMINTAVIFSLQVAAGKRWGLLKHAGVVSISAGGLIGCACLLLGVSGGTVGVVTLTVLVLVGLIHALGEIMQTTGSWAAGFELAPDHAQGQYQGLFATGVAASQMAGPALVTCLVLPAGRTGWWLTAVFFCGAGVLMSSVTRYAQSNRQRFLSK